MSFDVTKHVLHAGDGEELLQGPPATGKVRIVVDPRNTGETRFCTLVQELSPGGVVPSHRHEKAEQVLFFFSGRGKAVMEGHEVDVRPGTTLHVPPNVLHGFSARTATLPRIPSPMVYRRRAGCVKVIQAPGP